MTIQELARRANVTPRTIRYYVEQGILPPPERGRPAEYREDHLRRLELVRRLKEQYLPLNEIRDTMQRLSLDEVERLLATSAEYTPPSPPESGALSSAADYIASVLARSAIREEMKRQTPYASPPVAPGMPTPTSATAWSASALMAPPSDPEAIFSQTPLPAHSALSRPHGSVHPVTASTWQRVLLAPGIELHYVITDDAEFNQQVARLIEVAAEITRIPKGTTGGRVRPGKQNRTRRVMEAAAEETSEHNQGGTLV